MQTTENCQIEKHGRNEIITVAKILLTNLMVLIVDCDFSSIVIVLYTQQRRCCLNSLKFFRMNVFSCQKTISCDSHEREARLYQLFCLDLPFKNHNGIQINWLYFLVNTAM